MRRVVPAIVLILALALLYPLQRWIDATSPAEVIGEETLYFASGETVKKMSLGLDPMVADIYWIRAVQYFGNKVIENQQTARTTADIRMDLLAPMLNIIVTLDPHHLPAYRFGAIFLPERDLPAAIALLERGISANPDNWRLYQDLAYIYWQSGDYQNAAIWYERGSQIPGAEWWMRDLAGFMKIQGGSREAARAVYKSYLNSEDELIRNQAIERLKQLRSLDERDFIDSTLARYREQTGSCPQSFGPLARVFSAAGLSLDERMTPVDPDGFPYELDSENCRARLGFQSTILR